MGEYYHLTQAINRTSQRNTVGQASSNRNTVDCEIFSKPSHSTARKSFSFLIAMDLIVLENGTNLSRYPTDYNFIASFNRMN